MLLRATSALMFVMAAQAQAGTVLKTTIRDLVNNGETLSTTYVQQGSMRVEVASSSVVIFKDDVLYTLDPQQKTYLMVDKPTMQRMVEQLGPALKRMQDMLAAMPPEQRAELEKRLGMGGAGSKPVVEKVRNTGRSDKIAGYACSYSEVLRDDVVSTEACVAAPSALKGSQEFLDIAKRAADFVKPLTEGLDVPILRQLAERQVDNYARFGGMPVRMRRFDGGKAVAESTLQSITTEAVPATLFEIPAGYTKKDLPLPR